MAGGQGLSDQRVREPEKTRSPAGMKSLTLRHRGGVAVAAQLNPNHPGRGRGVDKDYVRTARGGRATTDWWWTQRAAQGAHQPAHRIGFAGRLHARRVRQSSRRCSRLPGMGQNMIQAVQDGDTSKVQGS